MKRRAVHRSCECWCQLAIRLVETMATDGSRPACDATTDGGFRAVGRV
jgi:hypothetical protein